MRLLLLGDIHTHRLTVPPWHLMGKALFGQVNLVTRRRHKFNLSLLPRIVERAVSLRPELVLLSGDLTTTAHSSEFADIARELRPLLAVAPAVAVPGNHDRYTFYATLTKAFERALPGTVPGKFPYLCPLAEISTHHVAEADAVGPGRWHLLALHASRPTLFNSRGRLGRRQLAAARDALAGLAPSDGVLVMCHYTLGKPPHLKPSPWHHLLADASRLTELLAGFPGRVVFIHGHVHYPWIWPRPEAALSRVLDVNAGAPCYLAKDYPLGEGFWEVELSPTVAAPIVFRHHVMEGDPAQPAWRVDVTSV